MNLSICVFAHSALILVLTFLSDLRVKPRRLGRGCKRGRRSLPFLAFDLVWRLLLFEGDTPSAALAFSGMTT